MLGVRDRKSERVGSIRRSGGRGRQQHSDHLRDLLFFGVAEPDDGLLDDVCRIFGDRQAHQGRRRQRDSAGLAELERRLRIAIDESLLDRGFVRLLRFDQLDQRAMDFRKTLGERPVSARLDRAARNEGKPRAPLLDQAVARKAQAGIDAEDANRADAHGVSFTPKRRGPASLTRQRCNSAEYTKLYWTSGNRPIRPAARAALRRRERHAMATQAATSESASQKHLAAMTFGALGVGFGDIGTSPLYTLKTVLDLTGGKPDAATILGSLSLILWTLFIITSVKYVNFAMRIDNDGEGGIIALMTLLGAKKRHRPAIIAVGLFGAALIYGDGAITPAISVLSALEGIEQAAPALSSYVLPLAVIILIALFAIQPLGTARIGRAFGPVMATWFVVMAILGISGIIQHPSVFLALNPLLGLKYLASGG